MDFLLTKDKEERDQEAKERKNTNDLYEMVGLTPTSGRRNRIGSLDEMESKIPNLLKNISTSNENHKSFILGVRLIFII